MHSDALFGSATADSARRSPRALGKTPSALHPLPACGPGNRPDAHAGRARATAQTRPRKGKGKQRPGQPPRRAQRRGSGRAPMGGSRLSGDLERLGESRVQRLRHGGSGGAAFDRVPFWRLHLIHSRGGSPVSFSAAFRSAVMSVSFCLLGFGSSFCPELTDVDFFSIGCVSSFLPSPSPWKITTSFGWLRNFAISAIAARGVGRHRGSADTGLGPWQRRGEGAASPNNHETPAVSEAS